MKRYLKKMFALLTLLSALVISSSFVVFAEDPVRVKKFDVNLNDHDESKPYVEIINFEKDGQPGWIKLTFTPAVTRDAATEGTWKSEAFWAVAGMTYRFDLSKSGSQWRISNARDLTVNCIGGTVNEQKLSIGRATSTSSQPAEITGSMTCNVVADMATLTFTLRTKVHNGEVSVEF